MLIYPCTNYMIASIFYQSDSFINDAKNTKMLVHKIKYAQWNLDQVAYF